MATGELYGRIASVQVEALEFEGVRVAFTVTKALSKDPNKLELKIYNLNETSRGRIQKMDVPVILQAGYKGTGLSQIFSGDARTVTHSLIGPDWITKITTGDGELKMRTSRIQKSFKKNTDVKAIFKELVGAIGLPDGNALSKIGSADLRGLSAFTSGVSLSGSAYDLLDQHARSAGLRLFVHDGKIHLLGDADTTVESAVLLNSDTGLVGSPERAEKGIIKAKSLLNGDLFPGRRVQLESREIKGQFRCEKVVSKGDTHGPEWFSELEMKAV